MKLTINLTITSLILSALFSCSQKGTSESQNVNNLDQEVEILHDNYDNTASAQNGSISAQLNLLPNPVICNQALIDGLVMKYNMAINFINGVPAAAVGAFQNIADACHVIQLALDILVNDCVIPNPHDPIAQGGLGLPAVPAQCLGNGPGVPQPPQPPVGGGPVVGPVGPGAPVIFIR